MKEISILEASNVESVIVHLQEWFKTMQARPVRKQPLLSYIVKHGLKMFTMISHCVHSFHIRKVPTIRLATANSALTIRLAAKRFSDTKFFKKLAF